MDRKVQATRRAGSWYLLAAVIVGAALGLMLGLMISWVWLPVEWTNTTPANLRSDFRAEYLLMVAERYASTRDLEWTRTRLGTEYWEEEQVVEALEKLARERSGQEAVALQLLADDLGATQEATLSSPVAQIVESPTSTPALPPVTHTPMPSTSMGTPRPTDTPAPTNTPTPKVTAITPAPTPTPTPCGPWFNCVDYTVGPNDTLYSLAQETYLTVGQLKLANCLVDDRIRVGQHLCLPFIPPTPTNTPTNTPPPTFTPTPKDTPTNTPPPTFTPTPVDTMEGGGTLPSDLAEEAYFSPGGGVGLGCKDCPGGAGPEIRLGMLDCVCLRGFPFDQEITVNLYAPSGDVYSGVFRVKTEGDDTILVRIQPPMTDESQEAGWAWVAEDGVRVILIHLWGAVSLPLGQWRAEASSVSAIAESWTEVEDTDLSEDISIAPGTGANPFVAERGSVYSSCVFGPGDTCGNLYSAGNLVQISGMRFPPNTTQSLGVYYRESESTDPAKLYYGKPVTTDSAGRFHYPLSIGSSEPSGIYWVTFGSSECAPAERMGDECQYRGRRGCFEVR